MLPSSVAPQSNPTADARRHSLAGLVLCSSSLQAFLLCLADLNLLSVPTIVSWVLLGFGTALIVAAIVMAAFFVAAGQALLVRRLPSNRVVTVLR